MMAGRELIRIITFTCMFFLVNGNFLRKKETPIDEFEIKEPKVKGKIDHPNDLCNRHLEYGWHFFGPVGLLRSREIFCTWVECAVPCWRKRTPKAKEKCVEKCDLYKRFFVASVNSKFNGNYFDIKSAEMAWNNFGVDPSLGGIDRNPYPDNHSFGRIGINPYRVHPSFGRKGGNPHPVNPSLGGIDRNPYPDNHSFGRMDRNPYPVHPSLGGKGGIPHPVHPSFGRIGKNPYPDVIKPVTKQPGDGKRLIIDIMKSCDSDCMNIKRAEEKVKCTKKKCKEFDYILPFVFPSYAKEERGMLFKLYKLWDSCMKVDHQGECHDAECIYHNCPDLSSKFAGLVPTRTLKLKDLMHSCKLDCSVKLIDDYAQIRRKEGRFDANVKIQDIVNSTTEGKCLEANLKKMCVKLAYLMKDH